MGNNNAAVMGSGTIPFTTTILHSSLGGDYTGTLSTGPGNGRGVRTGTQMVLANPEEISSVPAFRCSGISVGTSPINISNQISRDAILKRGRAVVLENLGPGDLYIGGTSRVSANLAGGEQGFKLLAPATNIPPQRVEIPVMNGCDIWVVASAGATDVRMLLY